MCIEANTVLDLCDLYPKTAIRIKWMAAKRREELQEILKYKDKTKTIVPFRWEEKPTNVDIKKLDRMFKNF